MRIAVGLEAGRRRFRQLQGNNAASPIVVHRAAAGMAGPEQIRLIQAEGLGHGVAFGVGQGSQARLGLPPVGQHHQR
jgi:hypothetical protein